ncbi:hypothetical protein ACE1TH_15535 [Shouchella sp. JSM 1781072]|uniref:hypothetical protein n=1 Tax=Bacillaceae TaxID=186817 RepID=UPI000C0777B3|nr:MULTISPECIES: hypothetical protein [Bacillaceae]UTR06012.1 hypothetical protein MM326_18330 [Alkalihalobacillus sp. LMS6]
MESTQQKKQSTGTGSLVFGILSLLIPYIGLILGIVAVVMASGVNTGMAMGGKVTGIIGIVYNGLMLLLLATGVFVLFSF